VARDACIVLEGVTWWSAKDIQNALRAHGFDVDRDWKSVFCFIDPARGMRLRRTAEKIRQQVSHVLREEGLAEELAQEPEILFWRADRHRYVNPSEPEEFDQDAWVRLGIDPGDVTHVVEITPADAFKQQALRAFLQKLARPLLAGSLRGFVLAALDEPDAAQLARRAGASSLVRDATPRRLHPLERWKIRQQIGGNYASEPGDYLYFPGAFGDGGGGS